MRRAAEAALWLLALACYWLFPNYLALLSQVWIAALFALSLDLLVGYAGVVTLGHAAFFGLGAYAAGILAVQGWGEPFSGLLLAGLAATLLGLLTAPLVLRGGDLAGLMVTLGLALMLYEVANKAAFLTGGADGLQGWKSGRSSASSASTSMAAPPSSMRSACCSPPSSHCASWWRPHSGFRFVAFAAMHCGWRPWARRCAGG